MFSYGFQPIKERVVSCLFHKQIYDDGVKDVKRHRCKFIHSFYEEITPQEWKQLEKEASKVKSESFETCISVSICHNTDRPNFPRKVTICPLAKEHQPNILPTSILFLSVRTAGGGGRGGGRCVRTFGIYNFQ